MPNVTDNDLDKLFREAADRNVPEFEPQDWEDMARRLEYEERAASMRSKSLYTLVAILFIYTLLPQWGQRENIRSASIFQTPASTEVAEDINSGKEINTDKEIIANSTTQDSPTTQESPTTQDKVKDSHGVIENEEEDLSTSVRIINSLRQEAEKANRNINKKAITKPGLENNKLENSNNSTPNILTQTDHDPVTGTSTIDDQATLNRSASKLSSPTDNDDLTDSGNEAFASDNGGFKGVDMTKTMSLYNRSPHEGIKLNESFTDADKIIKPIEQEDDLERLTTVVRPDRLTSSQRWFLKVPVSPDFSAIDYDKLGKPGINIGLLGEYRLTDHLSVSTGAIWSKKLYDSKNPDKSYTSGNWTGKASKLDGDCRVLDIPINVTYYIFPDRRTNLFVSLGSSSYIMLQEQYVYTVWANKKEYQYEENFSHKNNEWFSMLNLSIGIQQRLGRRFFAQAEPFLKAPVSGVGEGKVNLMSTGIFFSLKYSLNK